MNNTSEAEVLVTGATGLIGRWLLAALTKRGKVTAALVRGADEREDELRAFVNRLGGDASRLVVVDGDVEEKGLGLTVSLPKVRVVYHLAARFAFDLTRAEARRANVDGTRHVVEWASARRLDRFVYLGGYRMTTVDLASLDDAMLETKYAHGAYEGSKFESYRVFRQISGAHAMPWTAVHPSGVIGDSRTGETTQVVGIGETVQRLFAGAMPALAGSKDTYLPLVTVDYLADYLATVPDRAASAGKDLVVLDPASPNLPELVRTMATALGVVAPTTMLPLGLVAALPSRWTGLHREGVGFLSTDRYDTREGDAHGAAMQLVHPPLDRAIARWCEYLVSTRFLATPSVEGRFVRGVFTVGDPRQSEVVLLHGIPFDAEAMAPLARLLGVSTARFDLPGHGRSAPGTLDVIPSMIGDRTVLVGHSLGAAIAVRVAAAHPDKVRALVLIAPAFMMRAPGWTMQVSPLVARVLAGAATPAAFEKRFVAGAPRVAREAIESASAALARKGVAGRVARALAGAIDESARNETMVAYRLLRSRGVPVLIVHGSTEPLALPTLDAEVLTIEGAGHNLHLTHLDAIAPAIRGLVERPRLARASAA